jgi:hypothetical protein
MKQDGVRKLLDSEARNMPASGPTLLVESTLKKRETLVA